VLLLSLLAPVRADDVADGPALDRKAWDVGNHLFSAGLRLTDAGQLFSERLRDRVRGVDWAWDDAGLGFRAVLRVPPKDAPANADPATYAPVVLDSHSTWTLVRATARTNGTASGLDLVLASREAPVNVTWSLVAYPESPVVRGTVAVTNTGTRTLLLEAADALEVGLTPLAGATSSLTVNNFNWGQPATSFQTTETALVSGATVNARTGPGGDQSAWLAIHSAAWNAGIFTGWEWSGPGTLAATAEDGGVRIGVGFRPGTFARLVKRGETFTSPPAFLGFFSGGWDAAGAATRAFVTRRIAPALPAPDFPWAGFDTWGYGPDVDARLVEALLDDAASLGVETFTLDAGWFPRLGDWQADPARFPEGLAPLAARAHGHGMRFGLWIALGAVDPASSVAVQHPEWLAKTGGKPVPTDFDGVALCLADPHVRAWILGEVDRLVAEGKLDWLVHDFTVITGCDAPGHGHQAGDGWWASTAGYYAVLDEIRRRHPKLVLENCWDGGSLFDFGMVARHDTSATSDRNDAYGNQRAVYGGTFLVPPRYLDKYVGDDQTPDAYRFISALAGGPLLLMGRLTDWSPDTEAAARAALALYKQTRIVHRDGQIYHLTSQPGTGLVTAVESYDAKAGVGTIVVWTAAAVAAGATPVRVVPAGLSASALYDVSVNGIGLVASRAPQMFPTETGATLMSAGITLPGPPAHGAAFVTLTKR
jgi:hypothetical protein